MNQNHNQNRQVSKSYGNKEEYLQEESELNIGVPCLAKSVSQGYHAAEKKFLKELDAKQTESVNLYEEENKEIERSEDIEMS